MDMFLYSVYLAHKKNLEGIRDKISTPHLICLRKAYLLCFKNCNGLFGIQFSIVTKL